MKRLRRTACVVLAVAAASVVVYAQTSSRFSPTAAQCAALPDLDRMINSINACRMNIGPKTTVSSCMSWWLGWPTSCIVPASCTSQVDQYYALLTGRMSMQNRKSVPSEVGRAEAINGQLRNACRQVPATPNGPPASANQNLSLSSSGLAALIRHEGVVKHYYNDPFNCTYGVGTFVHYGKCTAQEVRTPVTDAQIAKQLQDRIDIASRAVREAVAHQPLTQAQFDALVSFTYNLKPKAAGPVLRQVDSGDLMGAATSILQYTHATLHDANGNPKRDANGIIMSPILPGLVTRRRDEATPFKTAPQRRILP